MEISVVVTSSSSPTVNRGVRKCVPLRAVSHTEISAGWSCYFFLSALCWASHAVQPGTIHRLLDTNAMQCCTNM